MLFRMNSPQGKAILALVREGDYAHPGEEEAIDAVTNDLPRTSIHRVLDIGCGRGGTANWFYQHKWGEVVAIDIDANSIDYAQKTYPQVQFHACDVTDVNQLSLPSFDLAYLFNSFYAFPDQRAALKAIRNVCRDGTHLRSCYPCHSSRYSTNITAVSCSASAIAPVSLASSAAERGIKPNTSNGFVGLRYC